MQQLLVSITFPSFLDAGELPLISHLCFKVWCNPYLFVQFERRHSGDYVWIFSSFKEALEAFEQIAVQ